MAQLLRRRPAPCSPIKPIKQIAADLILGKHHLDRFLLIESWLALTAAISVVSHRLLQLMRETQVIHDQSARLVLEDTIVYCRPFNDLTPQGATLMADTFTQIYLQIVFAVSGRQNLIKKEFKEELYKYITGIVRNTGNKLIVINGMPDHVHILIGLKPATALADLVRDIKSDSSTFINRKRLVRGRFSWQAGYGAFSYGHSQLDAIIRYIQNQERHHQRRSFKEEYLSFLLKFNIAFDEKYVFKFIE